QSAAVKLRIKDVHLAICQTAFVAREIGLMSARPELREASDVRRLRILDARVPQQVRHLRPRVARLREHGDAQSNRQHAAHWAPLMGKTMARAAGDVLRKR